MLSKKIVFGFATNKALIAEKQANAGLRDQRAAFECKYSDYQSELSKLKLGRRRDSRQYWSVRWRLRKCRPRRSKRRRNGYRFAHCLLFGDTRSAIPESNVRRLLPHNETKN